MLVLDLSDVPQVDYTSARALEDMRVDSQTRGREVCVVGLRPQVRVFLTEQEGVETHFITKYFAQRLSALEHAVALVNTEFQFEKLRSIP